jgi:hypothetical protein
MVFNEDKARLLLDYNILFELGRKAFKGGSNTAPILSLDKRMSKVFSH